MCRKCGIIVLALSLVVTLLSGCVGSTSGTSDTMISAGTEQTVATSAETSKAPAETAAAATAAAGTTKEEETYVTSTAVVTTRIADQYGQLQVIGTNLCDSKGNPVQLKGMSTHGIHAIGDFLTEASVQTLAQDWGCTVIRLALYTEESGYLTYPEKYYEALCNGVDLCIAQGVYVIIDWHILGDGNPMTHIDEAVDFFNRVSEKYGDNPNVIYEICNEPNSGKLGRAEQQITWAGDVKPYAEKIVETIRANDPDNIIIIGSPTWSEDMDIAAADPVEGTNLMYTLHFYVGSNGQELRDKVDKAIKLGAAIFVTEWGTTGSTGNGALYLDKADEWLSYLDKNMISWCNWSIGSSIAEKSNALKMSSDILTPEQKAAAHWPDNFITKSGLYIRSKLLGIPYIES
jgi:endoglucanase